MRRRTFIRRVATIVAGAPVFREFIRQPDHPPAIAGAPPVAAEPIDAGRPITIGDLEDSIATLRDEPFVYSGYFAGPAPPDGDEQLAGLLREGEFSFQHTWQPEVMQEGDDIRITMPDGETYYAEVTLVTVEPGPEVDSVSVSATLRPTGAADE